MFTHLFSTVEAMFVDLNDGIGFNDIAAFFTAIASICTFLWMLLRPLREQSARWDQFWDDWNGSPASPGRDAVPGVMERLQRIDGEFQRNGGSSLMDMVENNSERLRRMEDEHLQMLKIIMTKGKNNDKS